MLGSVIVISSSDKFSILLTNLMIDNSHFQSLDDFNKMYEKYPLSASKVILFESGIPDTDQLKLFTNLILDELSQVDQVLFIVSNSFKMFLEGVLSSKKNKKFLPEDITFKKLEEIVTDSKGYQLKQKAETVNVVQQVKNPKKREAPIPLTQTRVVIIRGKEASNLEKDKQLLEKKIKIDQKEKFKKAQLDKGDFIYESNSGEIDVPENNVICIYDSASNLFNFINSDNIKGRRVLVIDSTDSMLFSFQTENSAELKKFSLMLETIYNNGVEVESFRNIVKTSDLAILRNSLRMKSSNSSVSNLIKFIIGRYKPLYEFILVVFDDFKTMCEWSQVNHFIYLPNRIEYLMRFVNGQLNVENKIYIKMISDGGKITAELINQYIKKFKNIIVLNDEINLFDIGGIHESSVIKE